MNKDSQLSSDPENHMGQFNKCYLEMKGNGWKTAVLKTETPYLKAIIKSIEVSSNLNKNATNFNLPAKMTQ